MFRLPTQLAKWPDFTILLASVLCGLISAALWAAGHVDMRTQLFWSSVNWGVQQCPLSLLGLCLGFRVRSWRGASAMTALITCYFLIIYALDPLTANHWHAYVNHFAAFCWYELFAPILLVAATAHYGRRFIPDRALGNIAYLAVVFALVLAFVNSIASNTIMFYVWRGLLIYAVTSAAGFAFLTGAASVFSRFGGFTFIVLASPLAPLALGSNPIWVARIPLQLTCLCVFLCLSLTMLVRLEVASLTHGQSTDGNRESNLAPQHGGVQFSLLTFLLVVTTVGLGFALWKTTQSNSELSEQVRQFKRDLEVLPGRVTVRRLVPHSPLTWNYQIHLPAGSTWRYGTSSGSSGSVYQTGSHDVVDVAISVTEQPRAGGATAWYVDYALGFGNRTQRHEISARTAQRLRERFHWNLSPTTALLGPEATFVGLFASTEFAIWLETGSGSGVWLTAGPANNATSSAGSLPSRPWFDQANHSWWEALPRRPAWD